MFKVLIVFFIYENIPQIPATIVYMVKGIWNEYPSDILCWHSSIYTIFYFSGFNPQTKLCLLLTVQSYDSFAGFGG